MESSRRWLAQTARGLLTRPAYQPSAPFLYPFLTQTRNASILSSLSENKGHYNKKIRRGRGPASGKGKTSGRGQKGQKARGKVPAGFNGGQTPDWVVAGKRGFVNHFSADMSPVNLNRIQEWIDKGRLDPELPITLKELKKSRCIHGVGKDGVKLLGRGKEELRSKVNIIVSRASAEAISAVEAAGGSVVTRYYSPTAVKKIPRGEMDPIHSLASRIETPGEVKQYRYRLPDPISRRELEYYRDPAHRGYLAYTLKEGEGPSLYFKNPVQPTSAQKSVASSKPGSSPKVVKKSGEAKMW